MADGLKAITLILRLNLRPKDKLIPALLVSIHRSAVGRRRQCKRPGWRDFLSPIFAKRRATHSTTSSLYYNTQACFMTKEKWGTWNQTFQDEIVTNQGADGTWLPTGSTSPGNMNDPSIDAQLYRTTLCTLMLETYYRYLPTSR